MSRSEKGGSSYGETERRCGGGETRNHLTWVNIPWKYQAMACNYGAEKS